MPSVGGDGSEQRPRRRARRGDSIVVTSFALPSQVEPVYRRILPGAGQPLADVAASLVIEPHELLAQLGPLIELEIVAVEDGVLRVLDPAAATSRALAVQAADLRRAGEELARVAQALPGLSEAGGPVLQDARAIDGDVSAEADVPALIAQWIREKRGDVCFLRPDQWRFPSESEMAVAVGNAIREGRRVRAIYPARALSEAPDMLRLRAELGEEIRLAPSLPTRLAIVGPQRAIVPEPLGMGSDRRVVIRQAAVVGLCQAYFDELWEGATRVDAHAGLLDERDQRRLLLEELADGVKDEQIARNLDVSLRTVRRRVAALMAELDVDTRFQAGVEAVRRGWL